MSPASVEDDDIAARFAAGDERAFREAYGRWAPLVFQLARRAVGDRTEAEDITQNVFVSAWRGRGTLDPEKGGVPAWLVGIARHRIADALEARSRAARRDAELAARAVLDAQSPPPPDATMIEEELARLDPVPQQVVRMAYYEHLSHAQIADALDLPLGTVKSHIRRSIQQIRLDWEVDDDAR